MELKATELQIVYGGRVVVEDMDVNIQQDKVTTVIGPDECAYYMQLARPVAAAVIAVIGTDITGVF